MHVIRRIYGLLNVSNTASLHKYGCHVMICMTEGIELGKTGLWHDMVWQGTRFYDAWARSGLKPMIVACMMTHNLQRGIFGPYNKANRKFAQTRPQQASNDRILLLCQDVYW